MPKKLLILDIDETLIYASETPLPEKPDARISSFSIYRRPHLMEFLEFCAREFSVAVWTSATADYAKAVIDALFPKAYRLEFVFDRDRCTRRHDPRTGAFFLIKDLKKVKRRGFSLGDVIMIEDTPTNLARQYGNVIAVSRFRGDPDDRELMSLIDYLKTLKEVNDVRTVEKRGWWRRPESKTTGVGWDFNEDIKGDGAVGRFPVEKGPRSTDEDG